MKTAFKHFGLLISIISLMLPLLINAASKSNGSPKILNFYLGPEMHESDLSSLARWDMLVLDVNQQYRYPDYIRQLRQLNPKIHILAYVSASEIAGARFAESIELPMGKMAAHFQEEWYLHSPTGERTEFWPGSALVNVTDAANAAPNGQHWRDYLPTFLSDTVMSSGLWDGIFLDSTYVGISYFVRGPVDLNRDGIAESEEDANRMWQAGMRDMIQRIREKNPKALLMGNGGTAYADQLNGVLLENFPSWNWNENLREYREALSRNLEPKLGAINVNTKNIDSPNDFRQLRFGLASALMGDGYFSFDQGDANHHTIWWYDEYAAVLGKPKADGKKMDEQLMTADGSVWTRVFNRGLVFANGTDQWRQIKLPGVYERIHGKQDQRINNGKLVRQIDLDAKDGAILLRRLETADLKSAPFTNGSFISVFDHAGETVQNGFFAQRSDLPNGAMIASIDVDQDEKMDTISLDRGTLKIKQGNGKKTVSFQPFPNLRNPRLSLSIGNVDQDQEMELIVSRDGGGPSEIRVFNLRGTLLAQWLAYNPSFLGGVRTAIGDVDGDGENEIITAAGPGGGPHVKIWKTDGASTGGSFFAFDQGDIGGVSVAVGDVDGDGRAEIITGSGQGDLPRVRVFDARGTLRSEFSLGTKPLPQGLQVLASDVNEDGKVEILITGLSQL